MAFTPSSQPWDIVPESPGEHPLPAAEIAKLRDKNAALGRFDARSYRRDGRQAMDLVEVLQRVQKLSQRTLLVLLPEHSLFRECVPENATRLLVDTATSVGITAEQIIDLRAALPDTLFLDNYHLTLSGRRALSELLGQRLVDAGPTSSQ
jgi:hypothetical protein